MGPMGYFRCVEEGIDAEVKIFQQWDSSKPMPDIDNHIIFRIKDNANDTSV
jgi:hypothetical protein